MNIYPCRKCRAEAIVEADHRGWRVQCTVCPAEHSTAPFKSRDKAIRFWNKEQEAGNETE